MIIDYATLTKVGRREINEDYIGVQKTDRGIIFALADGLGGHGHGEVASKSVVLDSMNIYNRFKGDTIDILTEMFTASQSLLLQKQIDENCKNEMKSTLTLLCIEDDKAFYGHIGDSRIYKFVKGKYTLRTLDHSVPQALVYAGEIKESQIRKHEDRNRLLRVMGMEWSSPRFELCKESIVLKNGDSFLMCSDGFWEYLTERSMETCYKKAKSVQEWINLMEEEVLKNGMGSNMDNYSAIAVWIAK